jgi:hypothetical protein
MADTISYRVESYNKVTGEWLEYQSVAIEYTIVTKKYLFGLLKYKVIENRIEAVREARQKIYMHLEAARSQGMRVRIVEKLVYPSIIEQDFQADFVVWKNGWWLKEINV